ncbi:hypothetical protein D910_08089 [Dendroctonus ponderosae]|uniref:PXA domain-containing protein n=1 Tax=Dendroctonus ponderosae TaxID=77166 RepID=U4UCG2_DENPD|nr:hypothetical protein D910_08089 [Dendroctonus ponderosae]
MAVRRASAISQDHRSQSRKHLHLLKCPVLSPIISNFSFSGVLVFSCYIFGYLASLLLIKYQYYAISCLKKFLERYTHSPTIKLSKLKASCSVCDNLTCRRHYIAHSATPWKDIKISLELNNAIEHFFNKILTNFILVWYNQFTDSGEFVNELRYCFKYASATLINRFFRIDHIEIITNKLVPQFLKKQEQVHLLQFCLDVDDFNAKLLTPDLTKKQLEELHVQALNLHKEYFQEDSFNFIGCSSGICAQFSALIDDIYRVAKLRTSKPLYQAYDFAFNQLEGLWLPQFFHSNEFYKCICGSKATSSFNKAAIKSKRFCEQSSYGTVSKFSSSIGKIKGVLKTATPVEGCVQHLKTDFTENDLLPANLTRDLSNWKVTISSYKVIPDTKIIYFCLNISYVDNSGLQSISNNWLVWRKDQDFFTLKSKLVEFHGESEICDSPLPSRK